MHNGELCQGSVQKHIQNDGNGSNEMEIYENIKKSHITMYAGANSHMHEGTQIPNHLHE